MLDTAVIFRLNRLHSFTIALGYVMSPRQSRSQSSQDDIRFREDALSYPSDLLLSPSYRRFPRDDEFMRELCSRDSTSSRGVLPTAAVGEPRA